MKNLFILFLLLFLSWMGYGNSENPQTANKNVEHRVHQLACQAPPRDAFTGKLIKPSTPIYRDSFSPREAVWVAINPDIFDSQKKDARLYVVQHTGGIWDVDLTDETDNGYEEIKIPQNSSGTIYIPVWENPSVREEGYDLVVDFPPLGEYNKGKDIVDGITQKGFIVPKHWVYLESITFNHNPLCNLCDAINIRKNQDQEVYFPEWEKDKKSYPAAYIKNKCISILATFSAAPGVSKAEIRAVSSPGHLGGVTKKTVSFKEGEPTSAPIPFQVSIAVPDRIKSFYQEWKWFYGDVNGSGIPEIHMGNSRNKIYIVLSSPQSPWTTHGQTEPWTDVLDKACTWAVGETTPEGAAAKITRILYSDVGGFYDGGAAYTGPRRSFFNLMDFLDKLPSIGDVNCYDMGKALVTFSNVIGCDLNFRQWGLDNDINLGCVKAIGEVWDCEKRFNNHAFGSILDKVFDACISLDGGNNFCTKVGVTNLSLDLYKKKLVPEVELSYDPQTYLFPIIKESGKKSKNPIFSKKLESTKNKLRFAEWPGRTGRYIPVLKLNAEIFEKHPALRNMKNVWERDRYYIETIQGATYYTIRKKWRLENSRDILFIKMVKATDMEAAKNYLIYRYANMSEDVPLTWQKKMKIGDIIFTSNPNQDGPFYYIDFIRHNLVFIMWAKGDDIPEILGDIAKTLDEKQQHPTETFAIERKTIKKTDLQDWKTLEIKCFRFEKENIGRGKTVPLHLEIDNPMGGELQYFWEMSGGGIEQDSQEKFSYYGSEEGKHKVTVTVVNAFGLYKRSETLEIVVSSMH